MKMLALIYHDGVYHPRKPEKLRVVFDCSVEYQGHNLNSKLLSGPDFINNLAGVLLRFWEENVALTCDIQSMFHQVGVREPDRDNLRFLWWGDGNLNKEPSDHWMIVHLFVATSSPAYANSPRNMLEQWIQSD